MNPGFNLTRRQIHLHLVGSTILLLFVLIQPGAFYAAIDTEADEPREIRKLIRQSTDLVRRGQLAEAEKVLKRAIDLDPSRTAAKIELALVYTKQRRLLDAYELSFAAAKADPNNSRALAVLGIAFLNAGKFPEAKTLFYNSIKINHREDLAWAGHGLLDFYENRIQDSINNLQEAVLHEPNEADYLFALAQVCSRDERYSEAADAYKRFLAVSRNTDDERRARIRGLINFLRFLGRKHSLYQIAGATQTVVNFKLVGNRPVIQLIVNNGPEPLNFVLDTGSGISVISHATAKRLGVQPITKGGFAKGIGGDGKFEIVYGFLREVEIGGVKVRSVPVYIREFHNKSEHVDGYIGLSLISKFLTTIDYGALTFALERKKVEKQTEKEVEPDPTQELSLPLRLTSSGFLSGEVQVEGVASTLNFIVDTGASVSVISDDLASLSGISQFVRGERMRVIGSAGVTEDVRSFLLPKVTFGRHSRESVTAIALNLDLINEASGFEQAGILGGNFLRNYRLTFDFKNSKVTFVPIEAEKTAP